MRTQEIKMIAKNLGGVLVKNSPTILTVLSVSGLVATTIMGSKDTIKAIRILDELEEEAELKGEEPLTFKEKAKATWKCYIPTAIMGSITIGCTIGANSIHLRRNAALASLYSLSEVALKEYQAKVVETIGKNKEQKIKDEIHQEKIVKNPVSANEVFITGRGDTLCYDVLSGRYFKSDMEKIKSALNKLSRDLMSEMFVSVNQVYYELGLEGTKHGDLWGWHVDQVGSDLIQPDFSSQLAEDGRPCLVLDFKADPKYTEYV